MGKVFLLKKIAIGILLSGYSMAEEGLLASVPVAPINVGAYNFTDTSARISFKDISNNETGFRIKHVQAGNIVLATELSTDPTSMGYKYVNLTGLIPSTFYTIDIVTFNEHGDSAPLRKSFRTLKSLISEPINQKPFVNAGEDKVLALGESLELNGIGIDNDGAISSYLWKEGNEVLANTASFVYSPTSEGLKTLTFSIIDNDGKKSEDSMNLLVTALSMMSINDFGAIANDNKDDTEAIQKALNVNGRITMERGVYDVHGIVRLDAKTIIDGNGSTFKSKLETINNSRTSKNILSLQGDKIVIKNLLLDGAYSNGNSKAGTNVSSLLHIYDSKNILLDNVDMINHASNWWGNGFNFSNLNADHTKDMYHAVYIGFSKGIEIQNMEQRANIKTEGLLIYESDNIVINNFKSVNSPKIWTSLNIIASNDINLSNIVASDGSKNQGGSSINFIANHHFRVKNVKTTTKQGFDISNEISDPKATGRVTRDTSYGIFEDCHFEGQRALYGYPSIGKHEDLIFRNTKFIPTKAGYATWGVRIQKAGVIKFENCTFGSEYYKTFGIIMGNSNEIIIENSQFINPNIGVYIYDKTFGKVRLSNNKFSGDKYYPLRFSGANGRLNELSLHDNKARGKLIADKFYTIGGSFQIGRVIK